MRKSGAFGAIMACVLCIASALAFIIGGVGSPQLIRPASAQQQGPIYCSQIASLVGVTTKTQIVAPVGAGNASILVCGYVISNALATTVSFQAGTGSNCATNSVAVGPTIIFAGATGGITNDENVMYRGFRVVNPNALCVTATTASNITIYYTYQ